MCGGEACKIMFRHNSYSWNVHFSVHLLEKRLISSSAPIGAVVVLGGRGYREKNTFSEFSIFPVLFWSCFDNFDLVDYKRVCVCGFSPWARPWYIL